MNKEKLTEDKAEATPSGGVLLGKREGQTMIHDKGSLSGYLVGRTHAEGGIKAINKSTGQPLEMQGGEVVITAPAVSDTTKREFEGKMMTNREILSEINKRGGGVSFADGGNIPIEMHFSGNSYKYGGKTVSDHDIAYEISKCGCEHDTLSEGGKIDDMPASIKKKVFTADGERKITPVAISILTNYVNSLPQTKELNTDSKGNYTKERQELHRKIIDDFKDELICIQKDEPIAILMGGSPASGKSTFLRKYAPYLLKEEILKVDADEIRSMLPEYKGYNATQTHLETKDIVNTLLSDKTIGIPCKYDIIYDGTMNSTKSYLPLIALLKSLGYKIFIVYIDKVSEEVVKKRALERYKKSGRFVPMEVIDDFFGKGKVALEELKLKSDGYMIIDGSSGDYNILEKKGLRLPKKRMYSKLGEPLSKLEQLAHGGNLSKGKSLKQIAKMHGVSLLELNRQVKMGLSAESEHTSKVTEQMKIVKDHLYENPNYYTLLKEAGLKKGGEVDYVTYKDKYNKKYNYDKNTSHDLDEISKDTGVSLKGLQQIYNKGIGAYKTNPSSVRPNVKSKEQWAMARVYSAVMGGKASEVDSNELKMNHGGKVEYSLVKDAKSGNSPSRDLNNYNDLMDIQADGAVGGDIGVYANGGALGASGLPLVDYVQIYTTGTYIRALRGSDKYYDFESLKKRVAEEYKLLPNTPTTKYRDYITVQAYDTEGNELVTASSEISDMKNTVKNFNPYTGKPSDLAKSFLNSRKRSFDKYDWSEWFSGKKSMLTKQVSSTLGSKLVTGLYISYTNPTNNSLSSFTVDNASEFLYTLINLYKNSIKKIDYKLIIDGKVIDFSVFGLVLSDDPQDNWRTVDFRMNPNVTTVDDVAYRLSEQYDGLDLSKFIVSGGLNAIGQPTASTTSNLVEVPDNDLNFDKLVKSLPPPILGLLMIRALEQGINVDNDTLEQKITLVKNKIDGKIFAFASTQEGGMFWSEISKGRFTEFKRLYGKYGEKVKDIKVNIPTATPQPTTTSTSGLIEIPDSKNNFDGKVLSLPSPILELLLFRMTEQGLGSIGNIGTSEIINIRDVKAKLFSFENSVDGFSFWSNISRGDFTEFKQKYGKYGEKVKDIVGTSTISSSKFSTSEIALFEAIDDIVKEFNLSVKYPVLELYASPYTKDFNVVNEDTGEVFNLRLEGDKLGVQKADADLKKSVALLKDYLDWKKGGSSTATQQSVTQTQNIPFDLNNTKIWIGDNPALSEKIQKRAFELGFNWGDSVDTVKFVDKQALYFIKNNEIAFTNSGKSYFDDEKEKEIFESDLFGSATTSATAQPATISQISSEVAKNISKDNKITEIVFFDSVTKNSFTVAMLRSLYRNTLDLRNLIQGATLDDYISFHFVNKGGYSISDEKSIFHGDNYDALFVNPTITKGDFFRAIFKNFPELDFSEMLTDSGEKELYEDFKKGKFGNVPMSTVQSATTSASKTLYKEDLEDIKIKTNYDFDLALKIVEKLEQSGFTNTSGIRRIIEDKRKFHSIWLGTGIYVGWFEDEDNFNDSDKKEIFPSDIGIGSTTATATQQSVTQTQNNTIPKDIAENIANDNRVTACLFTDSNANEDVRYYLKKLWEYFVNMLEQDRDAQSFFHFENKDNKSISVKARMRYGTNGFQGDDLFIKKGITKDEFYLLIFDRYPELDFTNVLYDFEIDFYNEYKSNQKIFSQPTQTSQPTAPLTQEQKIASEFVADDSVLRRNDILGSASLQQDRNDLDALSKLLPSFQQSKFSVEKASILKEMARIQKKLDYKGFIASNEEVSKGKDLFTPQGLLNYYFTQATQNPTAELQPPCELPTPNGGKSKLPLVAYLNVRSSQFKKWFGDWEKAYETDNYVNCSKMIDEETKEPKIFYHGVRKYIPSFGQMSNMGVGVVRPYGSFEPPNFPASYFADNESYANFYGGIAENMPKPSEGYKPFIYKVFLCIKNPISLLPLDFEISYKDLIDYVLVAYGIRLNVNSVLLKQLGEDMDKKHPIWIYIRRDIGLIETLKDYGYDALIQQGDIPVFDKNGEVVSDRSKFIKDTEYLSFYPNQVKSATVKKSFYFNFFNDIRFKKGGYVRI